MPKRGGRRNAAALAVLTLSSACADAPAQDTLLVTSGFTDQVFVLDAATGAVVDSLDLDRRPGERDEPHGVAVSPDGRHWYATLSHGEPTLWKYESAGHRLVGRLTVPSRGASRVRLSPDGRLAAVPDYWLAGSGAVSHIAVVETRDLAVVGTPEVCAAPHDAVFSPDGSRIAVTCALGDGVVILDAGSLEELSRHAFRDGPEGAAQAGDELPPIRPMNAVWTADGGTLYVSLMARAAVVELDVTTGTWKKHTVGARPAQLELSPDGARLVVANRGDATLSIVDLASGQVRTLGLPGAHPHGVAFGPKAGVAYLTYEGDVTTPGGVVAVDLGTGAIVWHTPLGVFTLGIAYLPA